MPSIRQKTKTIIPKIKKKTEKKVKEAAFTVKQTTAKIQREIKKTIGASLAAAFGLVAALVWRDAVDEIINKVSVFLGLTKETYLLKLFTAIIITIICVIAIIYFSRWAIESNKSQSKLHK